MTSDSKEITDDETLRLAEAALRRAGTETLEEEQKRPFWRKKRFLIPALCAAAVYFLYLRPVALSPSTTANVPISAAAGDETARDCLQSYRDFQNEDFGSPYCNGYRILLAALGPRALNQTELANSVEWNDFPTNEKSRDWFAGVWKPLCQKFHIDPDARPAFFDRRDARETLGADTFLLTCSRPWTKNEFPAAADWLETGDLYYSALEEATERPALGIWLCLDDGRGAWLKTPAPDLAFYKELALLFAMRANYRIGNGDFDGALDDRRRIFRLARFLLERAKPSLLYVETGLQIINVGFENVDLAAVPEFEQNPELCARADEIRDGAFGDLDLDAAFQRALDCERNLYYAASVDCIATVKSRARLAELMFYDFDVDYDASKDPFLTRSLIRVAQFSAIGLDANEFLRNIDGFWQNPESLDQLSEGDLTFLAGLYSLGRKTRSKYFAGGYAISLLPALKESRLLLERTKEHLQTQRQESAPKTPAN